MFFLLLPNTPFSPFDFNLISGISRIFLLFTSTKVQMSINEDEALPRRLSYVAAAGEDQTNAGNRLGIMEIDPMKSALSETAPSASNDAIPLFSLKKIYKNLIVLSLAFVLLFTAYNGMVSLQSSLNVEKNVGVNSLIVTFAFLIVNQLTEGKESAARVLFLRLVPSLSLVC